MPNVGPLEIAVVLIIVLIIFGPKRLPELGKSMGRGIREFKNSLSGDKDKDSPRRSARVAGEPAGRRPATAARGGRENPAEPVEGEVVSENKA